MIRLRAVQNLTRKLFDGLNDIHYRLQYHPDLSPAGWYLGHGIFIEDYWLHEVIQSDNQFTTDKSLFFNDDCPLFERGPRLPALSVQLDEISTQQDANDLLLMSHTPRFSDNPLFENEFIENYIIQQYALHYESIHMVLNQIALKKHQRNKKSNPFNPQTPLKSQALLKDLSHIKTGHYSVGGEKPYSLDNELPAHEIQLDEFFIANTPVTNGQYLLFIEDGAYNKQNLWSESGWAWREKNNILLPEQWLQNPQGQYYGINHSGPIDLDINDSVYGLSHYEASAFANWAGARLPHEHEWEVSAQLEVIKNTTHVWEWCNNILTPYEGFTPFPYSEQSRPSFDNNHYLLKGAGQHTRPEIKRASFRNAHQPNQRHIFAGLRLVFE
jgi:ergothioneine biosynthesis protein EgtB